MDQEQESGAHAASVQTDLQLRVGPSDQREESIVSSQVLEYYNKYSQSKQLPKYFCGDPTPYIRPPLIGQDRSNPKDDEKLSLDETLVDAEVQRGVSPTSSVASKSKLEWDNGADIGYENCDTMHRKQRSLSLPALTSLEKIELQKTVLRLSPEGVTNERGLKSVNVQSTSKKCSLVNIVLCSSEGEEEVNVKKTEKVPDVPEINKKEFMKNLKEAVGYPDAASTPIASTSGNPSKHFSEMSNLRDTPVTSNICRPSKRDSSKSKKPKSVTLSSSCEYLSGNSVNPSADSLKKSRSTDELKQSDIEKTPKRISKLEISKAITVECTGTSLKSSSKYIQTSLQRQVSVSVQTDAPYVQSTRKPSPLPQPANRQSVIYVQHLSDGNVTSSTSTQTNGSEEASVSKCNSFEYLYGDMYAQKNIVPPLDLPRSSPSDDACPETRRKESIFTTVTSDSTSTTTKTQSTGNSVSESGLGALLEIQLSKRLVTDVEKSLELMQKLIQSNKYDSATKKHFIKKLVRKIVNSNYVDDSCTDVDTSPSDGNLIRTSTESSKTSTEPEGNLVDADVLHKSLHNNKPWIPPAMESFKQAAPKMQKPPRKFQIKTFCNEIVPPAAEGTTPDALVPTLTRNKSEILDRMQVGDVSYVPTKIIYERRLKSSKFTLTNNFYGKEYREEDAHHEQPTSSTEHSTSNELYDLPKKFSLPPKRQHVEVATTSATTEDSSSQEKVVRSWRDCKTKSEKIFETKEYRNKADGDQIVKYAKKERENQLSWIRNEITHLSKLKNLLENKDSAKHKALVKTLAGMHFEDFPEPQPTNVYMMSSQQGDKTPQQDSASFASTSTDTDRNTRPGPPQVSQPPNDCSVYQSNCACCIGKEYGVVSACGIAENVDPNSRLTRGINFFGVQHLPEDERQPMFSGNINYCDAVKLSAITVQLNPSSSQGSSEIITGTSTTRSSQGYYRCSCHCRASGVTVDSSKAFSSQLTSTASKNTQSEHMCFCTKQTQSAPVCATRDVQFCPEQISQNTQFGGIPFCSKHSQFVPIPCPSKEAQCSAGVPCISRRSQYDDSEYMHEGKRKGSSKKDGKVHHGSSSTSRRFQPGLEQLPEVREDVSPAGEKRSSADLRNQPTGNLRSTDEAWPKPRGDQKDAGARGMKTDEVGKDAAPSEEKRGSPDMGNLSLDYLRSTGVSIFPKAPRDTKDPGMETAGGTKSNQVDEVPAPSGEKGVSRDMDAPSLDFLRSTGVSIFPKARRDDEVREDAGPSGMENLSLDYLRSTGVSGWSTDRRVTKDGGVETAKGTKVDEGSQTNIPRGGRDEGLETARIAEADRQSQTDRLLGLQETGMETLRTPKTARGSQTDFMQRKRYSKDIDVETGSVIESDRQSQTDRLLGLRETGMETKRRQTIVEGSQTDVLQGRKNSKDSSVATTGIVEAHRQSQTDRLGSRERGMETQRKQKNIEGSQTDVVYVRRTSKDSGVATTGIIEADRQSQTDRFGSRERGMETQRKQKIIEGSQTEVTYRKRDSKESAVETPRYIEGHRESQTDQLLGSREIGMGTKRKQKMVEGSQTEVTYRKRDSKDTAAGTQRYLEGHRESQTDYLHGSREIGMETQRKDKNIIGSQTDNRRDSKDAGSETGRYIEGHRESQTDYVYGSREIGIETQRKDKNIIGSQTDTTHARRDSKDTASETRRYIEGHRESQTDKLYGSREIGMETQRKQRTSGESQTDVARARRDSKNRGTDIARDIESDRASQTEVINGKRGSRDAGVATAKGLRLPQGSQTDALYSSKEAGMTTARNMEWDRGSQTENLNERRSKDAGVATMHNRVISEGSQAAVPAGEKYDTISQSSRYREPYWTTGAHGSQTESQRQNWVNQGSQTSDLTSTGSHRYPALSDPTVDPRNVFQRRNSVDYQDDSARRIMEFVTNGSARDVAHPSSTDDQLGSLNRHFPSSLGIASRPSGSEAQALPTRIITGASIIIADSKEKATKTFSKDRVSQTDVTLSDAVWKSGNRESRDSGSNTLEGKERSTKTDFRENRSSQTEVDSEPSRVRSLRRGSADSGTNPHIIRHEGEDFTLQDNQRRRSKDTGSNPIEIERSTEVASSQQGLQRRTSKDVESGIIEVKEQGTKTDFKDDKRSQTTQPKVATGSRDSMSKQESSYSSSSKHSGSSTSTDQVYDLKDVISFLCKCCKKPIKEHPKHPVIKIIQNQENDDEDANNFVLCHPCYQCYQTSGNWHQNYKQPGHVCNCYRAVHNQTLAGIKNCVNELTALENRPCMTCNVPDGRFWLNANAMMRSSCVCGRKKSRKSAVAYMLTFEEAKLGEVDDSGSEYRVPKELEEVKVKIPFRPNKKKNKNIENAKRASKSRRRRSRNSDEDAGDSEDRDSESKENYAANGDDKRGRDKKRRDRKKESPKKKKTPSLQEALIKNHPNFVDSAESRRKCMIELAYLREKQKGEKCKMLLAAFEEGSPEFKEHLEQLKSSYNGNRLFTSKAMRDMTKKNYKKLPEVQKRLLDHREKQQRKANRMLADIFNKKLQRKALKGDINVSLSVNLLDTLL